MTWKTLASSWNTKKNTNKINGGIDSYGIQLPLNQNGFPFSSKFKNCFANFFPLEYFLGGKMIDEYICNACFTAWDAPTLDGTLTCPMCAVPLTGTVKDNAPDIVLDPPNESN